MTQNYFVGFPDSPKAVLSSVSVKNRGEIESGDAQDLGTFMFTLPLARCALQDATKRMLDVCLRPPATKLLAQPSPYAKLRKAPESRVQGMKPASQKN